MGASLLAKAAAQATKKPLPTRGSTSNTVRPDSMIQPLSHLPHSQEDPTTLAARFSFHEGMHSTAA